MPLCFFFTELPKAKFVYDLIKNMITNKEERIGFEKVIEKLSYTKVGGKGISYARDAVLGKGGFAIVYRGFYKGKEVAVKRIELNRTEDREVDLQHSLTHENVLKILEEDKNDDFRFSVHVPVTIISDNDVVIIRLGI